MSMSHSLATFSRSLQATADYGAINSAPLEALLALVRRCMMSRMATRDVWEHSIHMLQHAFLDMTVLLIGVHYSYPIFMCLDALLR